MEDCIRNKIKKLSTSEKIMLVEDIWDSVAEENKTFELSAAQKKELDRRLKSFKKNPKSARSWEEIKSDFFGK
ncbi:MAG: addiction module protein [Ignavibacteriales bacterium]|nr:addiction module protein [Ignavibacteriales bacterium]